MVFHTSRNGSSSHLQPRICVRTSLGWRGRETLCSLLRQYWWRRAVQEAGGHTLLPVGQLYTTSVITGIISVTINSELKGVPSPPKAPDLQSCYGTMVEATS